MPDLASGLTRFRVYRVHCRCPLPGGSVLLSARVIPRPWIACWLQELLPMRYDATCVAAPVHSVIHLLLAGGFSGERSELQFVWRVLLH